MTIEFYIQGKDFLTEPEAAHYACVSHAQFKKMAPGHGIKHRTFMGKKVYRKEDLQNLMENLWQPSSGEAKTRTSHTLVTAKVARDKLESVSVKSRSKKLRPYA
jgi:hypothetical protein